MIWNNERNIQVFNEYAGKICDTKLAKMICCNVRTIYDRRQKYGIPKFTVSCYPDYVVNYVRDNYKHKGNLEMLQELNALYPSERIIIRSIRNILTRYNLNRTREEKKFIRDQPFIKSKKSAALRKAHLKRSPQIGDIVFRLYSSKRQWVIKIGQRDYAIYAKYLWLQHFGNIPGGMRADWIDPKAALTIDNIKLIKYLKSKLPIGGITTWRHEGRKRELIKVAEGEFQLLLPYLWRLNGGEIPPGSWVEKIDDSKPSTIENLRLTHQTIFAYGSKNLAEWYVRGLLSRNTSQEFRQELKKNPELIQEKKAVLEVMREIKAFENGRSKTAT